MRKAENQIEGQISLFDFLEIEPKPQKEKPYVSKKGECEAYGTGCGGTIDPCRFGGPFKWSKPICKFSGHSCNKEELWKVAKTLDDINCKKVCCRNCNLNDCGARCNGAGHFEDMTYDRKGKGHPAPEWMKFERCENCGRWAKYPTNEQPPDGWGCYGWCSEHLHKSIASGYCMNFVKVQQEEKT